VLKTHLEENFEKLISMIIDAIDKKYDYLKSGMNEL